MPALPPQGLFNPGQGRADSWQLNESALDFVKRVPPLTTLQTSCEWIWVHNPYVQHENASNPANLISRGQALLQQSLQTRSNIQAQGASKLKTTMSRSLNEESRLLRQRIADLAVETKVLSGKVSLELCSSPRQADTRPQWMLFPNPKDVSRVWRLVVDGVINNRLGTTAKVAPDDGSERPRLICVYTRDFRDKDDIARVLQELFAIGVAGTGKSIYYKSDPYTYLNIYGETATQYGLQASLYSSQKMLAELRLAKAASIPQKKQSSLRGFCKSPDAMDLD
jgi:hypothetical protein